MRELSMRGVLVLAFALSACGGGADPVSTTESDLRVTPGRGGGGGPITFGPHHSPWLVLLCKSSDDPVTPAPFDFYQRLYGVWGAGTGGVYDYFVDQSWGRFNLDGTVVRGWYTVDETVDELNVGFGATRNVRVALCLNAAQAADPSISLRRFYGVVAVYNAYTIDSGAVATGPAPISGSGDPTPYGQVVSDSFFSDVAFNAHEMLHGYGQVHAHDELGTEYGDEWSIMGAGTSVFSGPYGFPVPGGGALLAGAHDAGPGMSAFEKDKMGWLSRSQTHETRVVAGSSEDVTIVANDSTRARGFVQVRVDGDSGDWLSIELRRRDGWDRAVPNAYGVLVRQIIDDQSYLLGARNGVGGALGVGQSITGILTAATIEVISVAPGATSATIRISPAQQPPPNPPPPPGPTN